MRNIRLVRKMNNYESIKHLPSEIPAPRQFLRYCFGFNKLTPEEILDKEISFGYLLTTFLLRDYLNLLRFLSAQNILQA